MNQLLALFLLTLCALHLLPHKDVWTDDDTMETRINWFGQLIVIKQVF
jgi:hypothetical protein